MFAGSPSSAPSSRRGLTSDRLTMAFGVLLFSGLSAALRAIAYILGSRRPEARTNGVLASAKSPASSANTTAAYGAFTIHPVLMNFLTCTEVRIAAVWYRPGVRRDLNLPSAHWLQARIERILSSGGLRLLSFGGMTCTSRSHSARSRLRLPFAHQPLRFRDLRWSQFRSGNIPVSCRISVPHRGRQAEPHVRDDMVLRHAPAVVIHDPEVQLSSCVALGGRKAMIGRLSKPAHRNRKVPGDTVALVVHDPEIVLGIDFALVRKEAPQ